VTSVPTSLAGPAVDHFQLLGGLYGAYTLDTLSPIVTFPHGGTPHIIAFEAAAEADVTPTTAKIRASGAAVEADVVPVTAKIRVNQALVEVDILNPYGWRVYEG
jgi:hypothetical protein